MQTRPHSIPSSEKYRLPHPSSHSYLTQHQHTPHHPPISPQIPTQAIQSLIPRLATTINDIDSLKAQLALGNQDGSLPSWDTLLQRYSILLGRIHALSQSISQPPTSTSSTSTSTSTYFPNRPAASVSSAQSHPSQPKPGFLPGPSSTPALAQYLVHPLNPLPPDPGPLAPDVMFQVINTQLLPDTTTNNFAAKNIAGSTFDADVHAGLGPTPTREALSQMSEGALGNYLRTLRGRMERETQRAQALSREILRQEEEVEWTMRVGEDEDDEEGGEEKKGSEEIKQVQKKREDEDEDDLFGGDEDDEGDIVLITADEAAKTTRSKLDSRKQLTEPPSNPREGWSVLDYLRYMDNGQLPQHAAQPPPPPTTSTVTN